MKINKNLRNCYIEVNLANILNVYPLARLFPKNNKLGHGSLTHALDTWANHLRSSKDKNYYIIDEKGSLFYAVIYERDKSKAHLLEGKRELTTYKQLQETLQERIKNFKV